MTLDHVHDDPRPVLTAAPAPVCCNDHWCTCGELPNDAEIDAELARMRARREGRS